MDSTFTTSFCNFPHNLKTGRPVGHECYVLPPLALAAERADDLDLANRILASSNFRSRRPVRGKRQNVVASLSDNRYDKPFRFLRRLGAYLVTLQDMTSSIPGMYDVVPDGGDRSLPKGIIEKSRGSSLYHAFLYAPGHAARYDKSVRLGEFTSLDDAVEAIISS
jgi:hypothetical protein